MQLGNHLNDNDQMVLKRESAEILWGLRRAWEARGSVQPRSNGYGGDHAYIAMKKECFKELNISASAMNGFRPVWMAATASKDLFDKIMEVRFAYVKYASCIHCTKVPTHRSLNLVFLPGFWTLELLRSRVQFVSSLAYLWTHENMRT